MQAFRVRADFARSHRALAAMVTYKGFFMAKLQ